MWETGKIRGILKGFFSARMIPQCVVRTVFCWTGGRNPERRPQESLGEQSGFGKWIKIQVCPEHHELAVFSAGY